MQHLLVCGNLQMMVIRVKRGFWAAGSFVLNETIYYPSDFFLFSGISAASLCFELNHVLHWSAPNRLELRDGAIIQFNFLSAFFLLTTSQSLTKKIKKWKREGGFISCLTISYASIFQTKLVQLFKPVMSSPHTFVRLNPSRLAWSCLVAITIA